MQKWKPIPHQTKAENLYPLYFQFKQYFDGSILLSEDEFDQLIQYHQNLGKSIVTITNEDKQPKDLRYIPQKINKPMSKL